MRIKRLPVRRPLEQALERAAVGLAWEELVAVDQVQWRHRFVPQCVDHVVMTNDMPMRNDFDSVAQPLCA